MEYCGQFFANSFARSSYENENKKSANLRYVLSSNLKLMVLAIRHSVTI